MATIQLPDGHTAELRDDELRRSDIRFVAEIMDRAMHITGNGDGEMQAHGVMVSTATTQDAIIARFLRSWTLKTGGPNHDEGEPLPITLEVVQDLPLRYYRPLATATAPAFKEALGQGDANANGAVPDPLSAGRS